MWSHLKTFVLAALLLTGVAAATAQIAVGDAFPALTEMSLSGSELPATDGKVVLVDFWASWCAPCKASFPAFARIHAEYAARGLVIVAVSVDENRSGFEAFVKKWNPPFVAVHDASQQLVRAVRIPAMPTSYLVGPDGRVRVIHTGYHGEVTERQLREHIEAVLAENSQS